MSKIKVGGGSDACYDEVLIGHNRNADGFVHTWYDVEGDPTNGATETTFSVHLAQAAATSDLYFTSEGYFQRTIPPACFAGKTDPGGQPAEQPDRLVTLKKNGNQLSYFNGPDQFHSAFLVKQADALKDDMFTIEVKYIWYDLDNSVKDYTVGLYTKAGQEDGTKNLQVLKSSDYTGSPNMLHMDGKTPSGRTGETSGAV